ncbi:uncharacterized protein L203_105409 [Cryptococcus depauperatus CBS 7841]|uniref:Uncharacterized protein n=1 Tax=Cryptococcus depauperatus CBS 7841 TaxID=1295531 RepID=A0AAJ8JXA9_9TREE
MPALIMSQLESVSAILGEYMLKGWTLTDLHCADCKTTPLMREPHAIAERENRERVQFCALCDGRPEARSIATVPPTVTATNQTASVSMLGKIQPESIEKPENIGTDPAGSISALLLKGYSLLADNCPNATCRGIPLVGYPKRPDGTKDGRWMCVSCGGRWVDEKNIPSNWKVPDIASTSTSTARLEFAAAGESPRSKRRRELYGLTVTGSDSQHGKKGKGEVDIGQFETKARESESELVGKNVSCDDVIEGGEGQGGPEQITNFASGREPANEKRATILPIPHPVSCPIPPSSTSRVYTSLDNSAFSLSKTLSSLSSSLEQLTSNTGKENEGKWFVDIKLHTEAMKDVLGVLSQVERARRVGW